jgi:hypothetical protein
MAQLRWAAGVVPVVASLLVALVCTAVAVIAVLQAGCAEPGYYVARPDGYELVGGCLEPGDLAVPEHPVPTMPGPPNRG